MRHGPRERRRSPNRVRRVGARGPWAGGDRRRRRIARALRPPHGPHPRGLRPQHRGPHGPPPRQLGAMPPRRRRSVRRRGGPARPRPTLGPPTVALRPQVGGRRRARQHGLPPSGPPHEPRTPIAGPRPPAPRPGRPGRHPVQPAHAPIVLCRTVPAVPAAARLDAPRRRADRDGHPHASEDARRRRRPGEGTYVTVRYPRRTGRYRQRASP